MATLLPAFCAVAVYAWSAWSFGSASAPSTTVAVSVGGAAVLAAAVAYSLLVDGVMGIWGALALVGALLLTVATADQWASRGAVADCVVVKVHEEKHVSVGEGGGERTVYRHTLRCPGGYPSALAEDRRIAPDGGEVRVAYDPRRRVAPAVEGSSPPWGQAVFAVLLLAAATAGARKFSRAGRPEREARSAPSGRPPSTGSRTARGRR
ncbi:hypothetical protein ABZY16_17620 [Streptomyces sp. NPDC006553]|uniref:hypothetical protein n=1 Tax=unclassified Streptomyces TaxID=2593676 RepID=UPI0022545AFF|nr:hypothetical protein [Streptomyces sp. NBC_00233]MCX5226263.1 hypothetical protein [Streptomyces sp. NBC_00233]